jgi:hypothetical protein
VYLIAYTLVPHKFAFFIQQNELEKMHAQVQLIAFAYHSKAIFYFYKNAFVVVVVGRNCIVLTTKNL